MTPTEAKQFVTETFHYFLGEINPAATPDTAVTVAMGLTREVLVAMTIVDKCLVPDDLDEQQRAQASDTIKGILEEKG